MSLVIEHLWKEAGGSVLIEDISLTIVPRAFIALVGPTSSGKTTLLTLLAGKEPPSRGAVTLDGMAVTEEPTAEGGVVLHRPAVHPQLTVLGNVARGAALQAGQVLGRRPDTPLREAGRAQEAAARALLAEVGLDGAEARYPGELSAAMQARLALAQSMMLKPRLLLLDEPFGALPPGEREELDALVTRLWNHWPMTVLLATQDLGEAFSLATRVIALEPPHDAAGAVITRDIEIWPPRVAGQATYYDADVAPEADEGAGMHHVAWAERSGGFAHGAAHVPSR